MDLHVVQPRGIFYARATKDAQAIARAGEVFYAIHELSQRNPDQPTLFEVLFSDGAWMLAREADLERF